ncbi:MAG TPA: HAMP domain-containing sensor histidine kinase [Noviherbaspirillum sp.]|uniref:sensor histidine kinase n=1 Tax=Noviherbaspirillum sp. TaxID=1926288 RepID=UPI002D56F61A|nr:HAMP domain-containing sensor histidine kinase [Noviherbaspirillum sp.]HYD95556.1 HAMP domain-containing sensor histidine kinase [Noviherbaspirillum sp.]
MRLADFISANEARIASAWEEAVAAFLPARQVAGHPVLLRFAPQILAALAADVGRAGTRHTAAATCAAALDALRQSSGFDVAQLSAEFLALRAGLMRLWLPAGDAAQLCALNEAIDHALAASIAHHSERIERARSLFLAMLGHDLRTPLGAIDLACQYLERTDVAQERRNEAVARISRCAGAMNAMIKDMLEFTRSRLGKSIPVAPKPAHCGAICHGVMEDVRAAHPRREFVYEESGDLACRVDAGRLHQVLWNLLNNAVQNCTPEAPVTLAAHGGADAVLLRVTHRGAAVPADILASIFDPVALLATADADHSPPANLSLGLYIAREIVRAHGGEIGVAPSGADRTVFTVRLPKPARAD